LKFEFLETYENVDFKAFWNWIK